MRKQIKRVARHKRKAESIPIAIGNVPIVRVAPCVYADIPSSIVAPSTAGMERINESSPTSSCAKPNINKIAIVEPEREIPGKTAKP